jgi:Uma2 family endonuclease
MYAASVLALCRCFAPAVDGGAGLAVRAPLSATHESDPAHDFAITSSVDSVSEGRPPPLLVADVTASALSRRLRVMLSARAGVPEHWVVRLGTGVIEAHRQPRDGAYAEVVEHAPGTSFSPLAFPDVRVEVSGVVSRFAGKITAGGS